MSDLDYLNQIDWREFPRTADGVLKVSWLTKERVNAWLWAQADDPMDADLLEIVESRCGFEDFTAATAIGYGFDELMRHRIYCCLSRLVRFKKIERQGKKGRYAYRLLPKVGRSEEISAARKKSVLGAVRGLETAKRYA